MKRLTFLIIFSALGCVFSSVNAQMVINIVNPNEYLKAEPIDNVLFTAQYHLKIVSDTLNPDTPLEETMMLKVGPKSSIFYSYSRFVTDSIFMDALKKSTNGRVQTEKRNNTGIVTYKIYKNYPSGKVTTLDQIAASRFHCVEENETPNWTLHPDTATILSYPCQKATCNFKGRDYVAWFTMEIPRSEGPWKLHGLPGLILRAADTQQHYVFECTGIEQSHGEESIMFTAEGYEPVSRNNLNKVYERYAADPIGFVASTAPNVRIVVKNEQGEEIKPKNTPFNPIERPVK